MSRRQNTYALALSGVMLAVTLVLNYLASFHLIRIDVLFYLISGALVFFTARRIGLRMGVAFCAAAAILSFAIVPDKVCVMLFVGVFGPCAVIQAAFANLEDSERIGHVPAAVLSVIIFIILFYVFAFLVAYGGGFLAHLGLPMSGTPAGSAIIFGFGVFSAMIAYVVNRNLTVLIERSLGKRGQTDTNLHKSRREHEKEVAQHIDLPKLYHEGDEQAPDPDEERYDEDSKKDSKNENH
ncbi:hypothetical protein AGMMS49983_04010 [Clostridia bacterium]|nr:hypothetical protein AGMMS49983_04010 [Clostridia bacterium]